MVMAMALLAAAALTFHPLEMEQFSNDVDVEPACKHWFDKPKGLWGVYPIKKFNDFYTFWNTLFYGIYKIIMAVV